MGPANSLHSHPWVHTLASQYGLTVRQVNAIPSHYRPAAIFRLNTTQGVYAVKPFLGTVSQLKSLYAATEEVCHRLHAPFAKWKLTRRQKPFVQVGEQCFYVTEWIDGSTLGCSEDDIRLLGKLLGRVHRIKTKANRGGSAARVEWSTLADRDQRFRRHAPTVLSGYGEMSHWLRRHQRTCDDLSDEAWSMLQRMASNGSMNPDGDETWVHGDVTRPNTLVTNHHDVVLIDWDQMHIGSSIYELVKTLANITDFNPARMEALLSGYESKRPLTSSQRAAVAALFRLPREAWYLVDNMTNGKPPTVFKALSKSWADRLDAIRWLDEWANRQRGLRGTPCDKNRSASSYPRVMNRSVFSR